MQRFLVCFDIPDDTTRKEVGDLLEGYGKRVQRSVFEIVCKNLRERQILEQEILKRIDQEADSVRFYPQCAHCASKAFELGNFGDPFDEKAIFFF